VENNGVSEKYLQYRMNVLNYTHEDMNLKLSSNDQVYIACFDIPTESIIAGNQVKTLALVFGLNTHIYFPDGSAATGLEKDPEVMKAMQSLLISAHQVLPVMTLTQNYDYYDSDNIRVYFRTGAGVYYKELTGVTKQDRFIRMLLDGVTQAIARSMVK